MIVFFNIKKYFVKRKKYIYIQIKNKIIFINEFILYNLKRKSMLKHKTRAYFSHVRASKESDKKKAYERETTVVKLGLGFFFFFGV